MRKLQSLLLAAVFTALLALPVFAGEIASGALPIPPNPPATQSTGAVDFNWLDVILAALSIF